MMRWLISLALVVLTFSAAAAPGDIMLELMASPAKFTDSLSLGHAFFCVEYQLNSGIKEDCFGFYPKTTSGMFVGGPGVTNSEFQKNPQRFSNVVSSYKSQLTDPQRRAIYKILDDFNQKNYSLPPIA